MFNHALVAVDFSPATDPMLECLSQLSQMGAEKLTLVYAMDIGYPRGPATEHLEHYRNRLEERKSVLEAQGFEVDAEVRVGYPAVEVLEAAGQHGVSLVVVGSHGHSPVGEVVLGSVARDIIHRSTIPVLLVRLVADEDTRLKLTCSSLSTHVLYATDFSPTAEKAFEYVERLAERGVGRISLMHIEERMVDAKGRLDELAERLRGKMTGDVETFMLKGSPGEEIVRWAEGYAASLVVMGSHRKRSLADIFLGSASHHVIRRSRVPVLLIPEVK